MSHLVVIHATPWCDTLSRCLDQGGTSIGPCQVLSQQGIVKRDTCWGLASAASAIRQEYENGDWHTVAGG